ncbi:MAG TPA: hypothetical protein P5313_15165 [Spirochaetia bacterium]|nr:hypothetical protein [Spirochaetales bacterium]HRY81753.1 hypothetical protein [Spirochaetia bacterium]
MNRLFDRTRIRVKPLAERVNKLDIERDAVDPSSYEGSLSEAARADAAAAAREAREARARGAPVILAFGAHSIKNGLSRLMIRLMEGGRVTHFATNGAGIIHDWEFAFQGRSGEDVRRYVAEGQFGIWEETGSCLNLALAVGAWRGLGYGESVGALVAEGGLPIPSDAELADAVLAGAAGDADETVLGRAAAAADLRALLRAHPLPAGFLRVEHPWARYCLSAAAYRAGVPFTCHPMFGHDIIYTHPAARGAPIGRTAELDFLSFADSVSRLEGGVYLSVGSAVMSPMIFEKALSMARNTARAENRRIEDFSIHVVDLAESRWDWQADGEPPQDNPAYYLRFCKTFSRMGGRMTYAAADNRAWLTEFLRELEA